MTLIYDPDLDLYKDEEDSLYTLNEFDPDNKVMLCVSSNLWKASYHGHIHYLDWDQINLRPGIKEPMREVIKGLMINNAISYLGKTRCGLQAIVDSGVLANKHSFKNVSITDLRKLWNSIPATYRSHLREWYKIMVTNGVEGALLQNSREMETWKARDELQHLRDVLNWHETKGALTASEEKIIRLAITNYKKINPKYLWIHIFCWLIMETLKRPEQILEMDQKSLKIVELDDGKKEYYVEIKPIKNQTGDEARWWTIPSELSEAIKYYSDKKDIKTLQNEYNRLIVGEYKSLIDEGQISVGVASTTLEVYVKNNLRLISPRTNKPLHIRPTRLRHTGATQLALQGVSRDIIKEILEHDSIHSAQAYIDAIASELAPEIEKADRNMGSMFYHLNRAFFHGKVIKEKPKNPIVIPTKTVTSLIVGGCGKNTLLDGKCDKHPFIGCYNGCSSFNAWEEQDHRKSLLYINQEIERWEKAEGHNDQQVILKEYYETREAINEVIETIEERKINA